MNHSTGFYCVAAVSIMQETTAENLLKRELGRQTLLMQKSPDEEK